MNCVKIIASFILALTFVSATPADDREEKRKERFTRFCAKPSRRNHRLCKTDHDGDGDMRTSPAVLDAKSYRQIRAVCMKRDCLIEAKTADGSRSTITNLAKSILGEERAEELAVLNYAAKRSLYNRDGLLEFISPVDNGMIGGVLLSEAYAEREIDALQNDDGQYQTSPPPPTSRFVEKRNAMYFGQGSNWTEAEWDSMKNIDYYIDPGFTANQVAIINGNILDIGQKTCLAFRRLSAPPSTEHIRFIPASSPAFCGLSIVGKIKPYNPIWLNFNSTACASLMKGTPSHEILHTLGLSHTHQRPDRDKFIRVQWSNIDPQYYDYYATTSYNAGYSTYGIPYDYLSITHYGTNIAALRLNKPTMTALTNPDYYNSVMGQRDKLSSFDAQLVNKIYCMPNCDDKSPTCGAWATSGLCVNNFSSMKYWCPKSCDLCPTNAVGV